MELAESAIDSAAVDPAAAAAAAVLVDLPQPAAAAAFGQWSLSECYATICRMEITLRDAHLHCTSLCLAVLWGSEGVQVQQRDTKHPRTVCCNRRIDKVPATDPVEGGRVCRPQCKSLKRIGVDMASNSAVPAAAAAATRQPKKRRSGSDPGEQQQPRRQAVTQRAMAPQPASVATMQRSTRSADRIAQLLEATHASRVAALALAAAVDHYSRGKADQQQ